MTGTRAQSRHNECTTPGARGAKSDARFVPACDYQDRFTEPPHQVTEAKQQGQGRGSPILVPGNVTDRPTPGHPRQRPPHPAPVAQWIEQAPSKRLAAGSSPAGGASTSFCVFADQTHPRSGPAADGRRQIARAEAITLRGEKQRLALGALRYLVFGHLHAHPCEASTATKSIRVIEKSSEAIAKALVTLAPLGIAEQVSERPRTCRPVTPEGNAWPTGRNEWGWF